MASPQGLRGLWSWLLLVLLLSTPLLLVTAQRDVFGESSWSTKFWDCMQHGVVQLCHSKDAPTG
jgi:hypothetical protein